MTDTSKLELFKKFRDNQGVMLPPKDFPKVELYCMRNRTSVVYNGVKFAYAFSVVIGIIYLICKGVL